MKRFIFRFLGGVLIASLVFAGAMSSANVTFVASEVTEPDDLRTDKSLLALSHSTHFDSPQALQSWQEFQVEGWEPKWETPRVRMAC